MKTGPKQKVEHHCSTFCFTMKVLFINGMTINGYQSNNTNDNNDKYSGNS